MISFKINENIQDVSSENELLYLNFLLLLNVEKMNSILAANPMKSVGFGDGGGDLLSLQNIFMKNLFLAEQPTIKADFMFCINAMDIHFNSYIEKRLHSMERKKLNRELNSLQHGGLGALRSVLGSMTDFSATERQILTLINYSIGKEIAKFDSANFDERVKIFNEHLNELNKTIEKEKNKKNQSFSFRRIILTVVKIIFGAFIVFIIVGLIEMLFK